MLPTDDMKRELAVKVHGSTVHCTVDLNKLIVRDDMVVQQHLDWDSESPEWAEVLRIATDLLLEWDAKNFDQSPLPISSENIGKNREFVRSLFAAVRKASKSSEDEMAKYRQWLVSDGAEGKVPVFVVVLELAKLLRMNPEQVQELPIEEANRGVLGLNYFLAREGFNRQYPTF